MRRDIREVNARRREIRGLIGEFLVLVCSLICLAAFVMLFEAPASGQDCGGPAGCPIVLPTATPSVIERIWVRYDGMTVQVEGIRMGPNAIRWSPDRPFNRAAIAGARAQAATPAPRPVTNYGVSRERLLAGAPTKEQYRAPSAQAAQFVAEAKRHAAEDAGKLHLTIIGPPADRAAVMADLATSAALAPYRDRLLVQEYGPTDWAVKADLGFSTNGKPAIYLQQKGGRVVWRSLDYSAGPQGLAEAIRKAEPSYDPSRDPGPATGLSGCPLRFTKDHLPAIVVVGVLVAFLLLRK